MRENKDWGLELDAKAGSLKRYWHSTLRVDIAKILLNPIGKQIVVPQEGVSAINKSLFNNTVKGLVDLNPICKFVSFEPPPKISDCKTRSVNFFLFAI